MAFLLLSLVPFHYYIQLIAFDRKCNICRQKQEILMQKKTLPVMTVFLNMFVQV